MIAALRRRVRAYAPGALRLAVALVRRTLRDRMSGDGRRFARRAPEPDAPLVRSIHLVQPIRNSAFAEGKLANIALGAARLDGITIAPGEIFSFWALIGRPSAKAGFRIGRSIRGDVVGGEIGGGLCQVSGIAYELLLRAGFEMLERHPHSRDLYTEEDRFTPLGLDATVVWPWRDLRLANGLGVPVTLHFAVGDMALHASLEAPVAIEPLVIEIERADLPGGRRVRLSRAGRAISDDRYSVG